MGSHIPISKSRICVYYYFKCDSILKGETVEFKGHAIIDTGCVFTQISAKDTIQDLDYLRRLKRADLENSLDVPDPLSSPVSCGVTNGMFKTENGVKNFHDFYELSREEQEKIPNVSFGHTIEKFYIEDECYKNFLVQISYDRVGMSLIGMDFLKNYNVKLLIDRGMVAHLKSNCNSNEDSLLYKVAVANVRSTIDFKELREKLLQYAPKKEVDAFIPKFIEEMYFFIVNRKEPPWKQ